MPLIHGYTPKSIRANVEREVRRGKSPDQAIAISFEEARRAWRHAYPRRKYPAHLRGMRKRRRSTNNLASSAHVVIAKRHTHDRQLVEFWSDGAITVGHQYQNKIVARGLPRQLINLIAEDVSLYDADELKKLVAAARKAEGKAIRHGNIGHDPMEKRRLMRVYAEIATRNRASGDGRQPSLLDPGAQGKVSTIVDPFQAHAFNEQVRRRAARKRGPKDVGTVDMFAGTKAAAPVAPVQADMFGAKEPTPREKLRAFMSRNKSAGARWQTSRDVHDEFVFSRAVKNHQRRFGDFGVTQEEIDESDTADRESLKRAILRGLLGESARGVRPVTAKGRHVYDEVTG